MNNKSNSVIRNLNAVSQNQNAALKQYQREINGAAKAQENLSQKSAFLERAMTSLNSEMNRTSGSLSTFTRLANGMVSDVRLQVLLSTLGKVAEAYIAGAEEARKFNQSLILTGNSAGTTEQNLIDISARVGEKINHTDIAADAALALINTGYYVDDNDLFEKLTEVVARGSKSLNIPVEKMAQNVVMLLQKPVETLKALENQFKFLDPQLLKKVVSLSHRGKSSEAGLIAAEHFADIIIARAKEVENNKGFFEKIEELPSIVSDKMKNIGRKDTTDEIQRRLNDRRKERERLHNNLQPYLLDDDYFYQNEQTKQEISELDEEIKNLEERLRLIEKEREEGKETGRIRNAAGRSIEGIRAKQINNSQIDRSQNQNIVDPPIFRPDPVATAYNQYKDSMHTQLLQAQQRLQNALDGISDSQNAATDALNIWLQTNEHAKRLNATQVKTLQGEAARIDETNAKLREQVEIKDRLQRVTDGLQNVQVQWLQATGKTAEATALEIEQRFKQLREDLEKTRNTAGLELVNKLANIQQAQAEFQQLQNDIAKITYAQERGEKAIAQDLEDGKITLFESRQKTAELRAQTAADLEKQLPDLKKYAESIGNLAVYDEFVDKLRDLQKETNELKDAFKDAFENQMLASVDALIDGSKELDEILQDFMLGIVQEMGRWAAKDLALQAQSGIMKMFSGFSFGGGDSTAETTEQSAESMVANKVGQGLFSAVLGEGTTSPLGGAEALMASTSLSALAAAATAATAALTTMAGGSAGSGAASGLWSEFSSGLSSFFGGYASGGFTGVGSKYQPAGVVHAGEFVLRREIVKKPGMRSYLEALNAGFPGYADGGLVVGAGMPIYQPGEGSALGNQATTLDARFNFNLIDDPNRIADALRTPQGQKNILLMLQRNAPEVRQRLGL